MLLLFLKRSRERDAFEIYCVVIAEDANHDMKKQHIFEIIWPMCNFNNRFVVM